MSVTDISSTHIPLINNSLTNGATDIPSDVDIFANLPPLHLSASIYWLLFYIFVYSLIFLGSIIGNQLVILSYIIEPKLRRPTNIFIVSLAVADFITGLIGLPAVIFGRLFTGPYVCFAATRPYLHVGAFMMNSVSIGHLVLITIDSLAVADFITGLIGLPAAIFSRLFTGPYVCFAATRPYLHLVTFMMCSVSVDHLVLITIDRYVAVTRPLKYPTIMTTRRCRIVVAFVWFIGGFFGTIPILLPPENPTLWVCGITRYEEFSVSVHRMSCVAFIPVFLFILCLVYIRIYSVVRKHVKERSERIKSQSQNDNASSASTSTTRTTVTTAIVLAAFAICWLPTTAKFALELYGDTALEETFLYQTAAEVLSFGNSMVNPIIYGYRNDLFRSTYKQIIRRACLFVILKRESSLAT
ncbi:Histamine H2 receptor [Holothuria leucospilota]|uniref:Histamine H2 receptor n=1 Tax=Holothuria leucospilota TaxID=206669 RepID=A0A9Q0YQ63_HOLLE|nr:Histamine H2 receptor [Holothuria leucospilota]